MFAQQPRVFNVSVSAKTAVSEAEETCNHERARDTFVHVYKVVMRLQRYVVV